VSGYHAPIKRFDAPPLDRKPPEHFPFHWKDLLYDVRCGHGAIMFFEHGRPFQFGGELLPLTGVIGGLGLEFRTSFGQQPSSANHNRKMAEGKRGGAGVTQGAARARDRPCRRRRAASGAAASGITSPPAARCFIEREVARRVEQYGDIAHVFSTYEARQSEGGPVILRGINSFQLVRHAGRWWMVSIMWQAETPQNPLPPEYLTSASTGERG